MADFAAADYHHFIGQGDDPLLMGDDNHGGAAGGVNLFEGLRQPGEAPQVDPGLRLIEHHEFPVAGEDGGDFDALHLTAGEGGVHLPVQVVVGAQADAGQELAAAVLGGRLPGGDAEQVPDGEALEPGRLLEAVADAEPRALRDIECGDVLSVPQDGALCGAVQAHDNPGQCGFPAAVGTGEHHQFPVLHGQGDILQDAEFPVLLPDGVGNVFEFQHRPVPPLYGTSPLEFPAGPEERHAPSAPRWSDAGHYNKDAGKSQQGGGPPQCQPRRRAVMRRSAHG